MRPIILLVILIIVIVSVRIDLTSGTIPFQQSAGMEETGEMNDKYSDPPEELEEPEEPSSPLPYQEVIVEPGQTVYGVVQRLHGEELFNIPLHEVLEDFEALNPDISPHHLLAGETYKFPLYETEPPNS
ncbi:hypothetical protein [Salipaludibacillus aurantiacus]|uniref:LysM domain-containing protein n=1 Tax=Salipaludibacillus aurantiacus TaxID=1601833 RepID=A0A1H9RB16_9BACI|nr:hypothetical protein [Salipaludibacillus aurantiacus]SER69249.1 hypothetical protein SAMN05518684_10345 [Salipaludibacillus aurantiacus]